MFGTASVQGYESELSRHHWDEKKEDHSLGRLWRNQNPAPCGGAVRCPESMVCQLLRWPHRVTADQPHAEGDRNTHLTQPVPAGIPSVQPAQPHHITTQVDTSGCVQRGPATEMPCAATEETGGWHRVWTHCLRTLATRQAE